MTELPLTIGPLAADGFVIRRSGVEWLCEDGHLCRANEVIGFCNIVVDPLPGGRAGAPPFADERELQVAFAPRVPGRFRRRDGQSPGGLLNVLGVRDWDPGTVLGVLEGVHADASAAADDPGRLASLVLAGRRMTGLADVTGGLLSGWHSRVRAWWGEPGRGPTVLSLGICDLTGVVRGERSAFFEMFEAAPHAAQMVFVPDQPLAPSAQVLLEQLQRTPAQMRAIEEDLRTALTQAKPAPSADDWMFAGALMAALARSPIEDDYPVMGAGGLARSGPADVILLSLNAEPNALLVHKTLGYSLHILRHHQLAAGPAVRAWLASAFEPVRRPLDAIGGSYRRLVEAVRARTGARILVLNRMSTSGGEDVASYSAFDPPLGETLANVASKELNLVLHDIEDEGGLAVIDADALAAAFGGGAHLPDGVHQSGALQAAIRSAIVAAIAAL